MFGVTVPFMSPQTSGKEKRNKDKTRSPSPEMPYATMFNGVHGPHRVPVHGITNLNER